MHFLAPLAPSWLLYLSLVITSVVTLVAAVFAPWRLLLAVPERQHLLFGTVVSLVLVWLLSIVVVDTFSFHLLLVTAAVLLLGWNLGVIAALLALVCRAALLASDWGKFGLDALCGVIVPSLVPLLALRLIRGLAFAGVFAFTLGAAFFGGAFSVLATAIAVAAVLWVSGQDTLLQAAWEQSGLLPLMMFGEGFINGTLMTGLAVFHPDLVRMLSESD